MEATFRDAGKATSNEVKTDQVMIFNDGQNFLSAGQELLGWVATNLLYRRLLKLLQDRLRGISQTLSHELDPDCAIGSGGS